MVDAIRVHSLEGIDALRFESADSPPMSADQIRVEAQAQIDGPIRSVESFGELIVLVGQVFQSTLQRPVAAELISGAQIDQGEGVQACSEILPFTVIEDFAADAGTFTKGALRHHRQFLIGATQQPGIG